MPSPIRLSMVILAFFLGCTDEAAPSEPASPQQRVAPCHDGIRCGNGGGSDGGGNDSGSDSASDGGSDSGSDSGSDDDGDCSSDDGCEPGDAAAGGPDAGATDATTDARPDAPVRKPHHPRCQGETSTTAKLRGTSGEHHVSKTDDHVVHMVWETDRIEHCNRNYCQDNSPHGVYFTFHGGTGHVTWKTVCKGTDKPEDPCVADITDHDPSKDTKFEDHNGKARHNHFVLPDAWAAQHTCAFSGDPPNIQKQQYCNVSVDAQSDAKGDHVAYGLAYSANHSSAAPTGVSVGVVAGPVFGAATFTPTYGTGTYGASRGWETQMICVKVREEVKENMIIDIYEPRVGTTKKYSARSGDENGTFPPPEIK